MFIEKIKEFYKLDKFQEIFQEYAEIKKLFGIDEEFVFADSFIKKDKKDSESLQEKDSIRGIASIAMQNYAIFAEGKFSAYNKICAHSKEILLKSLA